MLTIFRKLLFSEFVCKLKYRKNVASPTLDLKLLLLPLDYSKFTKCRIVTNETEVCTANRKYAAVDIFKCCPTDIIHHTLSVCGPDCNGEAHYSKINGIDSMSVVTNYGGILDPLDEKLCSNDATQLQEYSREELSQPNYSSSSDETKR